MNNMQYKDFDSAYAQCMTEAQQHYENFPTATRLIARRHQKATAAIYSFARRADDIADEYPELTDGQRLLQLEHLYQSLESQLQKPNSEDATLIALADSITKYQLPLEPFRKLITAFSMDVKQKRYADFSAVLHYCRHSANPIGELVLRLHGLADEKTLGYSDQICSALQLINFMQDIDEDFQQRQRIYIPQDEFAKYASSEQEIATRQNTPGLQQLVRMQILRARQMLINGVPLVNFLPSRLKLVIKITVLGGLRVCEKCLQRHDIFERPILKKTDWLLILARLMYFRYYVAHVNLPPPEFRN